MTRAGDSSQSQARFLPCVLQLCFFEPGSELQSCDLPLLVPSDSWPRRGSRYRLPGFLRPPALARSCNGHWKVVTELRSGRVNFSSSRSPLERILHCFSEVPLRCHCRFSAGPALSSRCESTLAPATWCSWLYSISLKPRLTPPTQQATPAHAQCVG